MSQRHVAILRRVIEAFNAADTETVLSLLHPDALEAACLSEQAMSRENVRTEAVQTWFEAFTDDPDAIRGTLHPEIEWFPFEANHTPSYGVDGAMRIRAHWLESWEDQDIDLEDFVVERDDVVVTAHVTARGKGSGVEVDVRLHFHFKLRDDKVVYVYEHLDKAKALEAAGQSGQEMSQENVEVANVVVRRWIWAFENDTAAFTDALHPKRVFRSASP